MVSRGTGRVRPWYTTTMQFLLALEAQLAWLKWVGAGGAVTIGIIGGLYFFWQKTKEENYELKETFDGLFFSGLGALLAARITYILIHVDTFPLRPLALLNILSYPGLWTFAGLVAAYAIILRTARQQKKEVWELWDFYTLLVTWFMIWWWLSRFFLGTAAGTPTTLPIGIMFPQRVEPAHPVQLYATIFFAALFRYLWWAEPRYRFFIWYRSKKRTAKPGFITAMFMIFVGLFGVLTSFIQYPFMMVFDFELNQILSAVMFIAGLVLLYVRSGQSFFKKEKGPYVTSFPTAT